MFISNKTTRSSAKAVFVVFYVLNDACLLRRGFVVVGVAESPCFFKYEIVNEIFPTSIYLFLNLNPCGWFESSLHACILLESVEGLAFRAGVDQSVDDINNK